MTISNSIVKQAIIEISYLRIELFYSTFVLYTCPNYSKEEIFTAQQSLRISAKNV
jgi:hypothetical protein